MHTTTEQKVLEVCDKSEGMGLTVQKIAEISGLLGGHVGRACVALEKKGLLEKVRSKDEDGFGPYFRRTAKPDLEGTKGAPTDPPEASPKTVPEATTPKPERMEDRVARMVDRLEQLAVETGYSLGRIESGYISGVSGRRLITASFVGPEREA